MIVVRLSGGLGNQMFQYCFGLSQALRSKSQLLLDTRDFGINHQHTVRSYELNNFKISSRVLNSSEQKCFKMASSAVLYSLLRRMSRYVPIDKIFGYYREKEFVYSLDAQKIRRNTYYDGYWQSYKYFEQFRKEILEEFIPKEVDDRNFNLKNEIISKNSVSLHVRRGDYVSNEAASQYHGVCDLDYYSRAIKELENLNLDLHFYLFSDDPKWVKENLVINHPVTIIDFNGSTKAYLDMYLLSLCRFHIIANSSFSWWGAWLSQYEGKIIFAPKKWFNHSVNTKDLIPESWIRI